MDDVEGLHEGMRGSEGWEVLARRQVDGESLQLAELWK